MSHLYSPEQRIPDGLRRLQILVPIDMVVELDVGIARSQTYLSRSKVIALAIKGLIDQGGLDHLDPELAWPTQPTPLASLKPMLIVLHIANSVIGDSTTSAISKPLKVE